MSPSAITNDDKALSEHTGTRVACVAWGSLIWSPRALPVSGEWQSDGPALPVEFARESGDKRITLVICAGREPLTTLWALLDVDDVLAGVAALARREGITKRIAKDIGYFDAVNGKRNGAAADTVGAWARTKAIDAVVWTNLGCGFTSSRGTMPSLEDVTEHLSSLNEQECARAREYFERAPAQINTSYRRSINERFGWTVL